MLSIESVRRLLCSVLLFSLVGVGVRGQPATGVRIPASARGAAAITALGAHLPAVAQAYGLDAQHLVTLLQTQPSLGVDANGLLNFVCAAPAANGQALPSMSNRPGVTSNAMTVDSSVTTIASGGTVDAFQLHSLPGVTRVIYLDFTGHTTSGTQWNSTYTGGANIVSAPFDLDGDPSTFNVTERAVIQGIWQRVAEDYAPFSVDVTTQDPGVEGLRRTTSSDSAYGIRAVISPTNWYGSAGGVGYIGSFDWNSDTPVFVFSANLANGEKYIGECASHEVGHSLGLYHDGLSGSGATEYYMGQGNWAPIMGNSYYAAVTQFSKGEYANANNTQDDLAVIGGYTPLVADDHGNTLSTATALAGPNIAEGGTIETRSDVDMFRFETGAGTISLNLTAPSPSPNLTPRADLLNSNGQLVVSSLTGAMSATVSAGTYYLKIDGLGSGDPVTTGYSDYDSIGNYVITGTIVGTTTITTPTTNQPPIAAASANVTSGPAPLAVTFSSAGSYDLDGSIVSYAWNFGDGVTATEAAPTHTYSVAGNYTAQLIVTDNGGATASSSVVISVSSNQSQDVDVRQFGLSLSAPSGSASAVATILIRDRLDRPVAGAAVTIQWSGLVSSSVTGTTDSNGQVTVNSRTTKRSGTITGSITNVKPPVGAYVSSIYAEPTVRSVTK